MRKTTETKSMPAHSEAAPKDNFGLGHQISAAYGFMYYVSDLNRSIKFYNRLLCLEPSTQKPDWVEYEGENFRLCLQQSDTAKRSATSRARMILEVTDLDFSTKMLKMNAVDVIDEKHLAGGSGRFTNLEDPDGNVIGLYQPFKQMKLTDAEKQARAKLSKKEQTSRENLNELDGYPTAVADEK